MRDRHITNGWYPWGFFLVPNIIARMDFPWRGPFIVERQDKVRLVRVGLRRGIPYSKFVWSRSRLTTVSPFFSYWLGDFGCRTLALDVWSRRRVCVWISIENLIFSVEFYSQNPYPLTSHSTPKVQFLPRNA